ncbi:MAG: twin-arginine translocase subunit TatC [Firmicutes bacterium]|nr:twin-arginine translocase subunit TatC [Bacillota bacterium]
MGKSEEGMTLVDHLAELRLRIIKVIAALAVGVLISFYFAAPVIDFLLQIPGKLVYLHPGEAFFIHLKLAVVGGLVVSFPIILYQVLGFIMPALRQAEKTALYIGLPFVMFLFLMGVVFAYKLILPLAFSFFMGFGTESLEPLISISSYVSFVLGLVIPFGIVFQLPLLVLLLTRLGILTPQILTRYRKVTILIIFALSAFLTPPDVISQILMAGPMVLLYEISILLSKSVSWRAKKKTK